MRSSTRTSWQSMKQRCYDPECDQYPYYGGRGITVCERWLEFENFLVDMGDRPEGMTLDRIDVNGNYEPSNCRWATSHDQHRNRTDNVVVVYRGRELCLKDACDIAGVPYMKAWQRINKLGWTVEEALDPDKGYDGTVEFEGQRRRIADVAHELGMKVHTLRQRLSRGWSLERALSTETRAYGEL